MNETAEVLYRQITPILRDMGLSSVDLDAGFDQLRIGIARLSLELALAENLGLPMREAVNDGERFPLAHRVHLAIMDILQMQLPPELEVLVRKVQALAEPNKVEGARLTIARVACDHSGESPGRGLSRFLLFEATRVNLIVLTWKERPDLLRVNIDDSTVDTIAEQKVMKLIENSDLLDGPEPVRPLHVLVSAAISGMDEILSIAKESVRGVAIHVREELDRRAQLERLLVPMDAEDAVLIRNYFALGCGEQRLSVERLSAKHSFLYEGKKRNSLDQKLKRKLDAFRQGKDLSNQRTTRLIDLLLDSVEVGHGV